MFSLLGIFYDNIFPVEFQMSQMAAFIISIVSYSIA